MTVVGIFIWIIRETKEVKTMCQRSHCKWQDHFFHPGGFTPYIKAELCV